MDNSLYLKQITTLHRHAKTWDADLCGTQQKGLKKKNDSGET